MKKKYAQGGRTRPPAPSYEEDITPPRGMRNFRPQMRPTDEGPAPSYEEDITPPRNFMPERERKLPIPPIPPAEIPPRRNMKSGGAVTRGDGCAARGKTKGRMV